VKIYATPDLTRFSIFDPILTRFPDFDFNKGLNPFYWTSPSAIVDGRSLRLQLQPGAQQGRFLRMLRHRKGLREGPTEARGICKRWKDWWGGYSTVAWRASSCRRSESQAEGSSPFGSKIQEPGDQTQRYGKR
jgi:hypothetical protein